MTYARRWRGAGLVWDVAVSGLRAAPLTAFIVFAASLCGSMIILGGVAAGPAAYARSSLAADRYPVRNSESTGVLVAATSDRFRGSDIAVYTVYAESGTQIHAPGVRELPEPGQVILSPAMREVYVERGSTLEDRYPGEVVATVGPDGLVGPHELVVWIGKDRSAMPARAIWTSHFGTDAPDVLRIPSELRTAVPLFVIAFFLPILVLFATAAGAGADSREQRLAALRLVGMSTRTTRWIALTEALLPVVPGVVSSIALFGIISPVVATRLPFNGSVWPETVFVSYAAAAISFVVVLGTATAASLWVLRRIETGPLGIVRKTPATLHPRRQMWPVAAGAALMGAAALARSLPYGVNASSTLLAIAMVLILVGLPLSLSTIVTVLAGLMASRQRIRWFAELAGARVRHHAGRYARLGAGSAVLVFISGFLLSFLPLMASAEGQSWRDARSLLSADVLVSDTQMPASADARLRRSDAVASVVRVDRVAVVDAAGSTGQVSVVDCQALALLLSVPAPCEPGEIALRPEGELRGPVSVARLVESSDGTQEVERLGAVGGMIVEADSDSLNRVVGLLPDWGGVIDRGLLDATLVEKVTTGGQLIVLPVPGTLESARTAVISATAPVDSLTVDEKIEEAERTSRTYRRITLTGLAVAGVIAFLIFATSLAAQLREQRREIRILWIAGTPMRTLRTSALLEATMVMVPGVLLALVLAGAGSSVFLALDEGGPARVPWLSLLVIGGCSMALPLIATFVTLPLLRVSTNQGLAND